MSGCTMPMLAAKIAVVPPMIPTTASAVGAYSKRGERRATMNTPAVTIVAAWIKAETGVGPSIASGSQVWSGICADFPIAPMNKRMQARVSESTCQPRNPIVLPTTVGAAPKTVAKSSEPKIKKTANIPKEKPKSPTRLTRNALIAAALAEGRSYQKPTSRYDIKPTPSQPKNSCTKLSDVTKASMKKVNRLK